MPAVDHALPESQREIRVLLVEDQVIIAMSQAQVLRNRGYVVDTVSSGEGAVAFARENADLSAILMDIDLGRGIDGTEAAQQILEIRDVPIIFLTSHSEKSMVAKVKGITRYGYVIKSSGEFVLAEAITMALELHKSHRATRRYAQYLQTTLDSVGDGVITTDADGTVVEVNPAAIEILQRNEESVVGAQIASLLPHDSMRDHAQRGRFSELVTAINAVLGRDDGVEAEIPGGEKRRLAGNAAPMRARFGDPAGMVLVIRDVTERFETQAALRASEARYRLLAENAVDFIWTMDRNLYFTYASPAAERLTGIKPEDWVGTKLRSHFTVLEYLRAGGIAARAVKNFRTQQPVIFQSRVLDKYGEEIDVEITGRILLDDQGRLTGLQGSTRQVTPDRERRRWRRPRRNTPDGRAYVDRRQAVETDEIVRHMARITEIVPEPMALISFEMRYLAVNKAFATAMGRAVESIIGASPAEFMDRRRFERDLTVRLGLCLEGAPFIDEQTGTDYRPLRRDSGDIIAVIARGFRAESAQP